MNNVPVLFAEAVVRSIPDEQHQELHGMFGDVAVHFAKKAMCVSLHIVYQSSQETVDYCLESLPLERYEPDDAMPYVFEYNDLPRIADFRINIHGNVAIIDDGNWRHTSIRAPQFERFFSMYFPIMRLSIQDRADDCSKLLNLIIPRHTLFNLISADGYNDAVAQIIVRSYEQDQLEWLRCPRFTSLFEKKEIYELLVTSQRLIVDYPIIWLQEFINCWIMEPEKFQRLSKIRRANDGSLEQHPLVQDICDCSITEQCNCEHYRFDHPTVKETYLKITILECTEHTDPDVADLFVEMEAVWNL